MKHHFKTKNLTVETYMTTINGRTTMKNIITLGIVFSVLAIGSAQAATWGGSGDWTSAGVDNWGLGVGAYPGDGANGAEPAVLTSGGTATIGTGDSINLTSGQNFQTATTTVNQSGGALTVGNNVRIGNAWNLSGGSMTFSSGMQFFNQGSGAEVNVSGGTFSTSALQWRGAGDITISGGSFTASGTIDLGFAEASGTGTLSILGSSATTVQVNNLNLTGGALSKTANFTFDNSGVDYWNVIGGGTSLSLDSSSFLTVDLDTYDAVNGDELFVYNIRTTGISGTFDLPNITITGDDGYGAFTLGAGPGSLNPGEYFIDYLVDFGASDGAVVLYANNLIVPEPSTLALLGGGLAILIALRRRKTV